MTDTPYEGGDRPEIHETGYSDAEGGQDLHATDAVTAEDSADDIDDDLPEEERVHPRYKPREGVDYINNFYALADVPHDADEATLKQGLDKAIRKYHPDRVDDLAEEFRARAAVVGPLLLRARGLLMDPVRRADYDRLLEEWDGPISTDGTPMITLTRLAQAEAAMLDGEGARELIDGIDTQIGALLGFDSSQLEAAERMAAKYPDDPDVRAALEAQLLEKDRLLALKETKRRELAGGNKFGIEQIEQNGYRVGLGYTERVAGELEGARQTRLEHERWLAIGGAAGRLALTGAEATDAPAPQTDVQPAGELQVSLPPVFETAVSEITDIAAEREELLGRRLDNLQLTYPAPEAQTRICNRLIVGFGDPANPTWLGFNRNIARLSVEDLQIDDETAALLAQGDLAEVVNRGYGVVLSPILEQVELTDLLNTVILKYFNRQR